MSVTQIVLYSIIALIVFAYVRRRVISASLKQYTPAELSAVSGRNDIVLLDVRSHGERQQRQIPRSIHIPLNELSIRMNELERHKAKEIVCYCLSGSRSIAAAAKLRRSGYQVANLKGGLSEWNYHHR